MDEAERRNMALNFYGERELDAQQDNNGRGEDEIDHNPHPPNAPYPYEQHNAHLDDLELARIRAAQEDALNQHRPVSPLAQPYGGRLAHERAPMGAVGSSERVIQANLYSGNDPLVIRDMIEHLNKEEMELLQSGGDMSADEIYRIRESHYFQRLELIQRLPKDKRAEFAPQHVMRMGVSMMNITGVEQAEPNFPYFIYGMMFIDIVVFIVSMGVNDWEFASPEENPMYGPSIQTLLDMGAKNGEDIRNRNQWWRLIMPLFLHAGIVHLLLNLSVLMRLGASMEEAFGARRVACIFFLSGVMGNIVSTIFLPNLVSVGASSAIFGLVGALMADFIQNHRAMTEGKWSYFFHLCLSTLFGLALGLMPLMDNFSHVGGYIAGLLVGLFILQGVILDRAGRAIKSWYTNCVAVLGFLAFGVYVVVCLSLLYSTVDANGWCSWCQSINCIDTSAWDCDADIQTTGGN